MRGLHSKLPVSEPISIFSADSNKTLDSEIKTFIESPFEIFDQIFRSLLSGKYDSPAYYTKPVTIIASLFPTGTHYLLVMIYNQEQYWSGLDDYFLEAMFTIVRILFYQTKQTFKQPRKKKKGKKDE